MRPTLHANVIWAAVLMSAATAAHAAKKPAQTIPPDSMSLRGDQDGTAFRTLTIEGEDRVHFEIERPALDLQVDPSTAPGLDWGSAFDVLDRTVPDPVAPFAASSKELRTPYLARPWMRTFASGEVATFRPQVENIDSWRLVIADSRGETVRVFEGKGTPKNAIVWDGRTTDGSPASPGRTYSYVFEARDRAGNKRNFVGAGFELPAYRLQDAKGPVFTFSADALQPGPAGAGAGASAGVTAAPVASAAGTTPPACLLEVATALNQLPADQPVQVTATARSFAQSKTLAASVVSSLQPLLLGDPQRVQVQTLVEPDANPAGTVAVAPVR